MYQGMHPSSCQAELPVVHEDLLVHAGWTRQLALTWR